jgi:hypothetical protein
LGRTGDVSVSEERVKRERRGPMETLETPTWEQDEHDRVERWRQDELERAGFPPRDAAKLAARTDVDLHGAVELLQRGCPKDLALKILL